MEIYFVEGNLTYTSKCPCEHCKGHKITQFIRNGLKVESTEEAIKRTLEEYRKFLRDPKANWESTPSAGLVNFAKW
jgi:hypothetical protein